MVYASDKPHIWVPASHGTPRLKQLEKAEAAGDAVGVEVVWYAFQGAAAVKRRGKNIEHSTCVNI